MERSERATLWSERRGAATPVPLTQHIAFFAFSERGAAAFGSGGLLATRVRPSTTTKEAPTRFPDIVLRFRGQTDEPIESGNDARLLVRLSVRLQRCQSSLEISAGFPRPGLTRKDVAE